MFQESPFSGVCAYSVLEVILMLVGTLLLGLLLGYLIWGWTRRKLQENERQLTSLSAANDSLNQQLAVVTSTSHEQERELDALNTRHSSQRHLMASLTVANSKLKKQLDEVGVGAEEYKSELENLQSIVKTHAGQITDLQTKLRNTKSRNTDLKDALKELRKEKARPAESPSVEPVDSKLEVHPTTSSSNATGDPFSTESKKEEEISYEPKILDQASEIFGKEIISNDFKIIEGIGPKIAEVLGYSGITTWEKLSNTTRHILRVILDEAGPNFRGHKPKTWPRQARMAANGEWKKLKAYQEVLMGGK